MQKKKLIFIKLGGSIITEKAQESVVRLKILHQVLDEVTEGITDSQSHVILGHGQGSFAHIPAKKYHTKDGFVTEESVYGMAVTHHSAGYLSRIIIDYLLSKNIPVLKFSLSSCVVTQNGKAQIQQIPVLESLIDNGIIPLVCGDVMADSAQGCTIWSTEKIFAYLISCLLAQEYEVVQIIHVSDVPGVLDENGEVIDIITPSSFKTLNVFGSVIGSDVTGGMKHKVQESVDLLEQHSIQSVILSGLKKNNLKKCLLTQYLFTKTSLPLLIFVN